MNVALYAPVSSADQKEDLERQMQRLKDYAAAKGYHVTRTVSELASGLNESRPKFLKLLTDPTVGVMVVEHKDRATRFGLTSIEQLLAMQGRRLEIIFPSDMENDLVDDFIAVITSFASQLSGRRPSKRRAEKIKQCVEQVMQFDCEEESYMVTKRGYRVELDLNNEQITACKKHCGAARFAYNWGLKRKQEAYKAGKRTPSAKDLHKEINVRKQTDYPWMYEVSKCAPQEALRHLDDAFKRFFHRRELKKQGKWKGTCGYPKLKSKKKGLGSCAFTGSIHVYPDAIQLPRLGLLKLKECDYLPMNRKIGSATLSEHAGRWYVSICVHEEVDEPTPAQGEVIGIDLGVKTLAMLSDGRTFDNPKALRKRLTALKRASRRHSRKKKGSNNRRKAQRRLAKMHARIARIRRDALHKATTRIVAKTKPDHERPRVIVLEDLNISGMLKNRKLSRAIADVGMYEFKRQIQYKAFFAGSRVIFANRWEPSSKTCSACGWYCPDLELEDRVFVCHDCGYVTDRDYNAAKNLAALAELETTVSSTGS